MDVSLQEEDADWAQYLVSDTRSAATSGSEVHDGMVNGYRNVVISLCADAFFSSLFTYSRYYLQNTSNPSTSLPSSSSITLCCHDLVQKQNPPTPTKETNRGIGPSKDFYKCDDHAIVTDVKLRYCVSPTLENESGQTTSTILLLNRYEEPCENLIKITADPTRKTTFGLQQHRDSNRRPNTSVATHISDPPAAPINTEVAKESCSFVIMKVLSIMAANGLQQQQNITPT